MLASNSFFVSYTPSRSREYIDANNNLFPLTFLLDNAITVEPEFLLVNVSRLTDNAMVAIQNLSFLGGERKRIRSVRSPIKYDYPNKE